ncbi:MAG: PIG-L family deacetylase [Enhygromyxa sp.]
MSASQHLCWLSQFRVVEGVVRLFGVSQTGVALSRDASSLTETLGSEPQPRAWFEQRFEPGDLAELERKGVIVPLAPPIPDTARAGTVVFEPHPDDAALSCVGAALRACRCGEVPAVITVFSSHTVADFEWQDRLSWDDAIYTAERGRERLLAAAVIGARSEALGLADARARGRKLSPRTSTAFRAVERRIVDELAQRFTAILDRLQPHTILAPAAIGWHVDHRLVLAAALEAAAVHDHADLHLFEDYPYAANDRADCWTRLHALSTLLPLRARHVILDELFELRVRAAWVHRSQFPASCLRLLHLKLHEFARATAMQARLTGLDPTCTERPVERLWCVDTGTADRSELLRRAAQTVA